MTTMTNQKNNFRSCLLAQNAISDITQSKVRILLKIC